jgi:taurine dioxygenase
MVISNIRKDGVEQGSLPDGELFWHFDRVHQPIPNRAGILQAIQLPASGGETRFVNMCKVYESLPGPIKERLKGLTAINTYDYGQTRAEDKKLSDKTPSAVHPVIRKIPETGEAALYVSRLMTDRIMELPMEESDELLEYLFDRTEKSEHRYEHTWQVNDILIWDNRCVVHARNDFDGTEPRLLKRLTVSDDQPPIPC